MTAPIVLMLEDNAERLERFHAVVAKLGVDLVSWPEAHAMIAEMGQFIHSAVLISLDHDLEPICCPPASARDPGDGLDVAKHLATLQVACPVIIHTSNGVRGDRMEGELELAGWKYRRVAPIGDDWIEVDWFAVAKRALRKHRKSG